MGEKELSMSKKALLVMDMPEKCEECPMLNSIDECILQSEDQNYEADTFDDLKSGCPLKPMPEKKEEMGMPGTPSMNDIKRIGFQKGWNACIDKIMGEQNEKGRTIEGSKTDPVQYRYGSGDTGWEKDADQTSD